MSRLERICTNRLMLLAEGHGYKGDDKTGEGDSDGATCHQKVCFAYETSSSGAEADCFAE